MGKIHQRFVEKQMQQMRQQDYEKHTGVTLAESLKTNTVEKFKGYYDGLCNRSACLSHINVRFYNTGSYAFYCEDCAHLLNQTNAKFKDINNGAPYVTLKTPEEAAELHVMPAKLTYVQARALR
jgi:hypothetical protein